MSKLTVFASLVAALLFQTGCVFNQQNTGPIHKFSCGSRRVFNIVAPIPDSKKGYIQVLYARPDDAALHTTKWFFNGHWNSAGKPPKAVAPGVHRIQFWAQREGDIPPRWLDVKVSAGRITTIVISYFPCRGTSAMTGTKKEDPRGPIQSKDTGSVTLPLPTSVATPSGYGQLQAVYVAPDNYTTNPTQWNIDGGSWRNVGSAAVTVYAGAHVVQFVSLKVGDTPPPPQTVTVQNQKLHKLRVTYTP